MLAWLFQELGFNLVPSPLSAMVQAGVDVKAVSGL